MMTSNKYFKIIASLSVVLIINLLILIGVVFSRNLSYQDNNLLAAEATYQDLKELIGTARFLGYDYPTIPKEGKFVLADLQKMELSLFQNGDLINKFKIASVGKEGKPWETPRGNFVVLGKEENHLSSITRVWMPYSLQFLGNYFIHGWPYYESGELVGEGFSGGCIRLKTDDAQVVYNFASLGTRLAVIGNDPDIALRSWHYVPIDPQSRPVVSAESYLVADLDSGAIILQKNSDQVYPIASITKLMTALVALDQINPISYIRIPENLHPDLPYRSVGGIVDGETMLAGQLLVPLLLESSNLSAYVLAHQVGENHFVAQLNKRTQSLGLAKTSFADPAGLSEKNVSTAEDLFKLTRHIFFAKNYIFSLTKQKEVKTNTHYWKNNNPFVNQSGFLGGKSGQTSFAKQAFINVFNKEFGSSSRRIVIIVLRSDNREKDTQILLDYLSKNIQLKQKNNNIND